MVTIKLINDTYPQQEYNQKVFHPLQSWEWGEARKKMGIDIIRFGEFNNEKLAHAYQMSIHPIPFTPHKIGYIPKSVFPSKTALTYLLDYAKKHKLLFVKIESDIMKEKMPRDIAFPLVRSTHPLFPPWTQKLDLTADSDTLLRNMKPKTRYNIRLAQKKGVTVKEMSNNDGFEIFKKLYFDTCSRQKYYGHTENYHSIIWETLQNNIAFILIAFYQNTPLAAFELFKFKDTVYYPYGGTSHQYRNVMAANLLMWESLLHGKKMGAKYFDMWGSLHPGYDPHHPWSGFTRFKEGYGVQFVQLSESLDLVASPLYYKLYNLIYILRNAYLRLKASV